MKRRVGFFLPSSRKGIEGANFQNKKPKKAVLSQDEVIRKALLNISSINVLVIKEVIYDEKLDVWTLRYKSGIITDGLLEEYRRSIPVER
jgi:hypothetical protein